MQDTLTVVTNSIPDTLRIVLSTSDKPNFWIQYSPLLVAVLIVVISSTINLVIAAKQRKITEIQIKDNREIEEKKIKADVIYKNKQIWLSEFNESIKEYLSLMELMVLSSKTPITDNMKIPFLEKFCSIRYGVLIKLDLNITEHVLLKEEIDSYYDKTNQNKSKAKFISFLNKHQEKMFHLSRVIIKQQNEIIENQARE